MKKMNRRSLKYIWWCVINKKNNTALEAHRSLASAFKSCSTLNDHEKANRRQPVYLVEVREQPDL